jgi:lysophospholipase L1-like esterase
MSNTDHGDAEADKRSEAVACLGSSTTASNGTYKWLSELQRRPTNHRFRFLNFGVGGDLSFNTRTRVERAIEASPDRAIVLTGANDILATVFPNFRRYAQQFKGLSQETSAEAFRANLTDIVGRLSRETNAWVALSSLAPVGEDPDSGDETQAKLNQLFADYNLVIREVASSCGTYYIAFYERFVEALRASGVHKPFDRLSFPAFYRDYLFRQFVQRRSFDEIARVNGWRFHIDGVHLNTDGGMILVESVQEFLSQRTTRQGNPPTH